MEPEPKRETEVVKEAALVGAAMWRGAAAAMRRGEMVDAAPARDKQRAVVADLTERARKDIVCGCVGVCGVWM